MLFAFLACSPERQCHPKRHGTLIGARYVPFLGRPDDHAARSKLLRKLNEPDRTMVSLIAATGLRIGELVAAVVVAQSRGRSVSVRESVFEGKLQAPKTQRALRTIQLGPYAVKAINEHRDRVSRKGDDDLVRTATHRATLTGHHVAFEYRVVARKRLGGSHHDYLSERAAP